MYREYYGLNENPFSLTTDVRFLYWSQTHQNAFRHLHYSVQSHKGLIALAGEVGTGKTTLLHVLMEWIASTGPKARIAYVVHSTISVEDLFRYIFDEFDLELRDYSKVEYILALKRFALHCAKQGERLVLILDEAQNYAADVLEEIRLLSNIESHQEQLLQIVLAGQPQLVNNINQPALYQLKQRISILYTLHRLSQGETAAYIQKRLEVAGAQGRSFFHDDAIAAIHRHARGIPRVINLMCDHALLYAYAADKKLVSRKIVEKVVADAGLEQGQAPEKTDDGPEPDDAYHADHIIIRHARGALGNTSNSAATSDEIFTQHLGWRGRKAPTRSLKKSLFQLVGMAVLLIGIGLGTSLVPWPTAENETSSAPPIAPVGSGTNQDNGRAHESHAPWQNVDKEIPANPAIERTLLVRNAEQLDDSPALANSGGEKAVIVQAGDTLRNILLTAYGRYDESLVSTVLAANPNITDINVIFVGQRIHLPEY